MKLGKVYPRNHSMRDMTDHQDWRYLKRWFRRLLKRRARNWKKEYTAKETTS